MHEQAITGLDAEPLQIGDEAGKRMHAAMLTETAPLRKLDPTRDGRARSGRRERKLRWRVSVQMPTATNETVK